MKITHQHIIITLAITTALTACSKQNWYHGAQSAQIAQCMGEPLSEYQDCKQQSNGSYQDYKNSKKPLQNQESKQDY